MVSVIRKRPLSPAVRLIFRMIYAPYSITQLPEYRHVLDLESLPSSSQTGRKRALSCEAAKALGRASLFR